MHYVWGDRTIGWLADAAEYTGFYRNIAALLLPHIRKRGSLCDMGCGMALADLALAGEIEAITCVDVNGPALTFAQQESARRGTDNLRFLLSDGLNAAGRWDTVMALFHGRADIVCPEYLRKANDRLLLVTHGAGVKRGMTDCENADETAFWLDAQGWRYAREDHVLEFGQPHRSIAEAIESTAAFHRERGGMELEEFVRSHVRDTGRADFPYYTPKTRALAIFDLPRAENEHLL